MTLFSRIREWISPSMAGEKKQLVERIEEESERLNGAVSDLTRQVRIVRKERMEMNKMFDDALDKMSREYRK